MRPIKVKIVKENKNSVTIFFVSTNRKMPVKKEEFDQRVKQGVYEIIT